MSSTNKTTHYELSQYISSDKPTYLTDYNGDMSKIDTGIYNAKNEADTNATNIGSLASLTTDTKSTLVGAINEVDSHADTNAGNISQNTTDIATNTSHIGTMTNLETTEKTNLVGAINELKNIIANFNLTSYTTIDPNDIVASSGTTGSFGTNKVVKIAKNSDGSLAKIYGNINYNPTSNTAGIVIHNSGLAPESDITINCAGIVRINGQSYSPAAIDLVIRTNGDLEIPDLGVGANTNCGFILFPCLYFIKDFGDSPIPA